MDNEYDVDIPTSLWSVDAVEPDDPHCLCGNPCAALTAVSDSQENVVEVFFLCFDCTGLIADVLGGINQL